MKLAGKINVQDLVQNYVHMIKHYAAYIRARPRYFTFISYALHSLVLKGRDKSQNFSMEISIADGYGRKLICAFIESRPQDLPLTKRVL